MKIFGLTFFLLMFFTSSNAQWQKQNIDTKAGLRGLSVVNQNVIWASGTGGTVLKTIDGGKTWSVMKVPDAEKLDFRDIEAFDANTAYILSIGNGESSRIYKTTDGGKTWRLGKGLNGYRSGVAYIDRKTIIAVGASGSDFSTDGGKRWKNLDKENYNAVAAKGKNAIWAVGANGLVAKFSVK